MVVGMGVVVVVDVVGTGVVVVVVGAGVVVVVVGAGVVLLVVGNAAVVGTGTAAVTWLPADEAVKFPFM